MSRAGRKRKAEVPRRKGRIDWRAENEDPRLVATWNRAREVFAFVGRQPDHATQAGKMHFFRYLSDHEMEAAKRWRDMLATYHRIVLSQAGSIKPSSLERMGITLGPEWDDERIAAFRARFDAAQCEILRLAGREGLAAVNRLCRDEAASSVILAAKKALAALIEHFGIKAKK